MNIAIPEFGSAVPGQKYVHQPGSYGVISDSTGAIAVVITPLGVFLPGGGQESNESTEAALIREVLEECGLGIQDLGFVGVADELFTAGWSKVISANVARSSLPRCGAAGSH